MSQPRRSKWITDRSLQLRLIFVLLLIGALNFLFYCFTLLYFFNEMQSLYMAADLAAGLPEGYLDSQRLAFIKAAVFGFLIQMVFIALLGTYFSSRISGPIYRLNSVFLAILAGDDVPVVTLRKNDFLQEFKDNFNRVVRYYNDIRDDIVRDLERISSVEQLNDSHHRELRNIVRSLKGSQKASTES